MRFRNLIYIVLLLLIILRLFLPAIVLHYIVNQVNKIPEYRVHIAKINLHIITGNYTIHNLELWKINKQIPVPFFKAKEINISIQWRALFQGRLVGKITVNHGILNFVKDSSGKDEQLSISKEWLSIVKPLFPLNINQLIIHHSKIYLKSLKGKNPFSIFLKNVELQVSNMQKVNLLTNQLLSSSFHGSANGMDGSRLNVDGKFNPFAKQPTFYIKITLRSLNILFLNNFLKHYTNVKADRGWFSLYGEAVAKNGYINGYIKPFMRDFKVAYSQGKGPLQIVREGVVAIAGKLLENRKQKTIATKIKITGKIDDPNTSFFSIAWFFIQHGFFQALLPQIDNNYQIKDIFYISKQKSNKKE